MKSERERDPGRWLPREESVELDSVSAIVDEVGDAAGAGRGGRVAVGGGGGPQWQGGAPPPVRSNRRLLKS